MVNRKRRGDVTFSGMMHTRGFTKPGSWCDSYWSGHKRWQDVNISLYFLWKNK